MNLVKLEDDLKQLPEQTLIGYVQSPQNQVPTYLVLAELERRKRMKQGAMASMQQQNTTVADRMVAEAQPQPQEGLAALPVENVGNEAAYAAGGIVAFEDGGEVQRYQNKGLVQLSPEQFASLSDAEKQQYLTDLKYAQRRGAISETAKKLGYAAADIGTMPMRVTRAQLGNIFSSAPADIANTILGRGQYEVPEYEWISGGLTPYYDILKQEQEAQRASTATRQAEMADRNAALLAKMKSTVTPTGTTRATQSESTTPPPPPPPGAGRDQGIRTPRIPTTPAPVEGIAALEYTPAPNVWDSLEIPQVGGIADYAKEMRDYIGEDPAKARMLDQQAKMEALEEANRKSAFGYGLAAAGFEMMAGESPYAAVNIGKGGVQLVKSMQAEKERAAKAQEKLFDLEVKLAEKDRAEQLAVAEYGARSKQAAEASRDRRELEKFVGKAQYEQNVADKKYDVAKTKLEFQQRDREIDSVERRVNAQIAATTNQTEKQLLISQRDFLKSQFLGIKDLLKEAERNREQESIDDYRRQLNEITRQMAEIGGFANTSATEKFDAKGNRIK